MRALCTVRATNRFASGLGSEAVFEKNQELVRTEVAQVEEAILRVEYTLSNDWSNRLCPDLVESFESRFIQFRHLRIRVERMGNHQRFTASWKTARPTRAAGVIGLVFGPPVPVCQLVILGSARIGAVKFRPNCRRVPERLPAHSIVCRFL